MFCDERIEHFFFALEGFSPSKCAVDVSVVWRLSVLSRGSRKETEMPPCRAMPYRRRVQSMLRSRLFALTTSGR